MPEKEPKDINIHSFNRVIRVGGHDFFFALLEHFNLK